MAGKFNSIIDETVYGFANDVPNEEIGSVDELGWFGKVVGFEPDDFTDIEADPEDVEQVCACYGAIVEEDQYGFVTVTYYSTKDILEIAWDKILSDYEEYDGVCKDSEDTEE